MGLRGVLLRYAARRPRPLVVPVPGFTAVRLAAEAELRHRGWRPALSPAEADLLVVCGSPGHGLARAIDTVWDEMPGPRARADALDPSGVLAALDAPSADLADEPTQLHDAATRTSFTAEEPEDHAAMGHDSMSHEGMGHGMGHAGMDHGDMGGHGGHEGHGGGHEHHMMGAPHGLAMAGRAPDRDGLKLDVLHVPFGPVLADWPAGLRVTLTLQGDVVQAAEVETLGGGAGGERFWDESNVPAARLDSLARLLSVAGWTGQAAQARLLRDEMLDGRAEPARIEKFVRRTRRSRTLRWMLQDVRLGDFNAWTRMSDLLAGISGETPPARHPAPLGELLVGVDVAAVRLIVAALDPETEGAEVTHV
ncbi:hypothetical protein [Actinomadura rupiterrae]|uniref:hypothetical protein n=1 Tax=Actinomadura rupiterrae TaxID=559627 RepID=UPI0020A3DA0F|nr:hypothetical protein [Actinomadura rupiterrae]MCP2343820.1 hypothetical protein [Actinomadura rupiterrae]